MPEPTAADARTPAPIRVVIADDHALVLEGMRALIDAQPDLHLVATCTDGERAVDAVRRLRPDVLVLDLQMDFMGGLEALAKVRDLDLPVQVLVLSAFGDARSLKAALEQGADGFALKTGSPEATLAAIRQVARGQLVFPAAARRWLAGGAPPGGPDALTEREEAVLALVARGASNGRIAQELHLSESTVKFHLRNLFGKLGVRNRTEAAARFHER